MTDKSIKYLKRCFNFCVSQNKFECKNMRNAINNIPDHVFNLHANCGDWCTYKQDPTYVSKNGNFQDPTFYEALKNIFSMMADKCEEFVGDASSNPNESLNNSKASKNPKSRIYSMSSAGDIRNAATMSKKNVGDKYVPDVLQKVLSPGKYALKFSSFQDKYAQKRYKRSLTKEFCLKISFQRRRSCSKACSFIGNRIARLRRVAAYNY